MPFISSWCNLGVPLLAVGHITEPLTSEWCRPNACPISCTATHKSPQVCFFHHQNPEELPNSEYRSSSSKWIRPSGGKYACAKTFPGPSNGEPHWRSPCTPEWVLRPKLMDMNICLLRINESLGLSPNSSRCSIANQKLLASWTTEIKLLRCPKGRVLSWFKN